MTALLTAWLPSWLQYRPVLLLLLLLPPFSIIASRSLDAAKGVGGCC
jgi:hypothetical protein